MFTGIISHLGKIVQLEQGAHHGTFWIETMMDNFVIGESIAIDGVCLTVTDFKDKQFACQISPETMERTITSQYRLGTIVNLERPLTLQSRIGGHYVLGHVDGMIVIKNILIQKEFTQIQLSQVAANHQPLLTAKGSIALNGVSLTINNILSNGFTVMIIPHTAVHTNLSQLKVNDRVNIEYDYFAKLIQTQLTHHLSTQEITSI